MDDKLVENQENDFIRVYDNHADGIFRFCYFRVYNREKAADMTQEAFVRTWQFIASGKKIDNIRAFVYRVARNLIIDDSRKKKATSLEDLLDNREDLPESLITHDAHEVAIDVQVLRKAIYRLKPKHREVIVLRYMDDLVPSEIAEILQESANAVSLRLNRAIKELRQLTNYDK